MPIVSAMLSGVADSVAMETRLQQGGGGRAPVESIRDLTDGVFSFTMTVVFASVGFPLLTQEVAGQVMAAGLLVGVFVFWMVAMVWQHHSIMLQYLDGADFLLRRDNLRVLGAVCLMPYAFGWSMLTGGSLGYVAYMGVYAIVYVLQHRLWVGALDRGLARDGIERRYLLAATEWSRFRARAMVGIAGVSLVAALVAGVNGAALAGTVGYGVFAFLTWSRMRSIRTSLAA